MAAIQYYDVIQKPVITEKSMEQMADKKYTFLVHPEATKTQIKEAVFRHESGGREHDESRRQDEEARHDLWKDGEDQEGHRETDRGQRGH